MNFQNINLQKLLFSFHGRIGRATFWLTIVPLVIAVQAVSYAPLLMVSTESGEMPASFMAAMFAMQFIWLASLWPLLAVGSKRLHDRNKSGAWLLLFWLVPFLLFFYGFSIDFFADPKTVRASGYLTTGSMLIYASFVFALWGIVELGMLPGTKGPNSFGAEPGQEAA